MTNHPIKELDEHGRAQLEVWVREHETSLPEFVRVALSQHAKLVEALASSHRHLMQVVVELRRAMGVTPRSERRSSGRVLGAEAIGTKSGRGKSKREKLEIKRDTSGRLSKWHQNLARRHRGKMKDADKKLRDIPVEEIELSAEDEAELAEQDRQFNARLLLGDGADPSLESAAEALMTGHEVATSIETRELQAPEPQDEGLKVIKAFTEERVRHDFTLSVNEVVVKVEKKVVLAPDGTRRIVSAKLSDVGPPHYGVTWEFLTNTSLLVAQYAMPMNRLGKLLTTDNKRFTAASLWRMLLYVGARFMPIYLELFDELSDAGVILGDDTPARVLEVMRAFAAATGDCELPWHHYRTREAAQEYAARDFDNIDLEVALSGELGFEFPRRTGEGPKRSLNTTTISGRADERDPRSAIVFYRSHLGGFGNLLEMLLERRSPQARALTVQSDLATVNLVTNAGLLQRFDIRYAGCASHARRPFALYENDDPDACAAILHGFKGLFIHEYALDAYGRNAENVRAVRGNDSRRVWEEIREYCGIVARQWSRETRLGEAARYVLRHYDKLTAYLDDPRLSPTNNFSERMLRLEKLIESSSMFRATLRGRCVLDILRTVIQTAVAARTPLQEYLTGVLKTPLELVAIAPERYTPHAWAKANL